MPAQIEKVVGEADLLYAQHILPDSGECNFSLCLRRDKVIVGCVRVWEPRCIDRTIGLPRQTIEFDDHGGRLIFRQVCPRITPDLTGGCPRIGCKYYESGHAHVAQAIALGDNSRIHDTCE